MNETKQILQDARKLLKKGWTKDTFFNTETKCYCAMGAINKVGNLTRESVSSETPEDKVRIIAAAKALVEANRPAMIRAVKAEALDFGIDVERAIAEYSRTVVIRWNDTRGRTQQQVLDAFTKAIKSFPREKAASAQ
jgi:hypothetical protein